MAITLKRQLNEDDKRIVLSQHGRKCYATGHVIAEGDSLQFDHISAYATGGDTSLNNIAPMCALHNQQKGTLPLYDFRAKLRMDKFFEDGDRLTLRDLLGYLKAEGGIHEFGIPITVDRRDNRVVVESAFGTETFDIYVDPIRKWEYFFAQLDANILDSDDSHEPSASIQPRYLIRDKVFNLFRHFQSHPVLQPSLGRIVDNSFIRLFDGQHKAAALLWNGHTTIECKVFLDPDPRLLNQTNIHAHDTYSQTRFYSSVMVEKLGSQFGTDFEAYKNMDDNAEITEAGFVAFLREKDNLTKGEVNTRFRNYLYSAILSDEGNKISRLVSAGNRSTAEKPLTTDVLSKSVFAEFLYRSPLEDAIATENYMRDAEVRNVTQILNELYDSALFSWNPKADKQDPNRMKLERIFASKSMMAWAGILKDAVCGKLDLYNSDERSKPLYRELTDQQRGQVRDIVVRLVGWNRWDAPVGDTIDRILPDKKSAVKQWFLQNGLDAGYLMGAQGS